MKVKERRRGEGRGGEGGGEGDKIKYFCTSKIL